MSKVATRTIQTPGEVPQTPETPETPKPDAFTAVALQTGMEPEQGESEVDRLNRIVEAQQAQMASLTAAIQALARGQQNNGAKPGQIEGKLPDQSEINIATLESPVLTRQGWLVPADYGMSPEDRAERERQRMTDKALQALAARG